MATLEALEQRLNALEGKLETTSDAVDTAFLLIAGAMVFLMQAGFAMLEAGSVTRRYSQVITFKNMADMCTSAMAWYAVGFGFAFGTDRDYDNPFIGNYQFFLSNFPHNNDGLTYQFFFFQYAFCAAAVTIVSGAVAERTKIWHYLAFATFQAAFVYPVVVHWTWSRYGFLSSYIGQDMWKAASATRPIFNLGMIDFAGSGVVHLLGGTSALWASFWAAPRNRYAEDKTKHVPRFTKDRDNRNWFYRNIQWKTNDFPAQNEIMASLGLFLLWFGWYGFNPGSVITIDGFSSVAARAAVNTTLAPAAGGLVAVIVGRAMSQVEGRGLYNLADLINGILAGLVAITGPCAVVDPWAAVVIGAVGGVIVKFAGRLHILLRIDDPVDAAAVHCYNGAWGLIASGVFARRALVRETYLRDNSEGIIYGDSGAQLGAQLIGLLCILVWASLWSNLVYGSYWCWDMLMRTLVLKRLRAAGFDPSWKHKNRWLAKIVPNPYNLVESTVSIEDPDSDAAGGLSWGATESVAATGVGGFVLPTLGVDEDAGSNHGGSSHRGSSAGNQSDSLDTSSVSSADSSDDDTGRRDVTKGRGDTSKNEPNVTQKQGQRDVTQRGAMSRSREGSMEDASASGATSSADSSE